MFFKSNKPESEPQRNGGWAAGAKAPPEDKAAEVKPSPEQLAEIKKRATKSKHLQAAFGEIVGLLMRTPEFKKMPLAALEQVVLPAITNGQFSIAEAQSKKSGFITPVAAVLWANVSEEIDQQLSENRGEPVKLSPKDWKSGDIPWLILAAGDKRLIHEIRKGIEANVLKGRPLKSRVLTSDDKNEETPTQLN